MKQNKKFIRPSEVPKLINALKNRRHITAKSVELKKDVLKIKSDNAHRKLENRVTNEQMVVSLIHKDPKYLPMLCMKRVYSGSLFSEAFLEKLWKYGESSQYVHSKAIKMIDDNAVSGKNYRQLDPSLLSNISYNYRKQLIRKSGKK